VSIGENVKKARIAKNLSCEKLAAQIGCSTATIVRLEADKYTQGVLRLERLAAALDVTVGALVSPESQ
jgi:transcriptional regulator with XRE-family HTH domain